MTEDNTDEAKQEKIDPANVVVKSLESDIPGVRPKVAEGIVKLLKSGRRYFGSSGASLTHQVHNPDENSGIKPELAKVGLEGERETTKIIREWMKDKPNVVLIDSVHINMDYKTAGIEEEEIPEAVDEEAGVVDGKDTDHVLLIGDEVVLVDTKRWKTKRRYSIGDDGSVLRSNRQFSGSRVRMKHALYLWMEYLYEDAVLNGIVFVNSEETSVTRNYNWYKQPFRLVEKDRFIELLDDKWARVADEDKTSINPTLVSQVALSAIKPFDVYKKVFSEKALNEFMKK